MHKISKTAKTENENDANVKNEKQNVNKEKRKYINDQKYQKHIYIYI